MKEQLITFETAKLAEEKGFDVDTDTNYFAKRNILYGYEIGQRFTFSDYFENCVNGVDKTEGDYISAPTQSLLQKWLREKHRIIIEPIMYGSQSWDVRIVNYKIPKSYDYYRTYEQALEKGLQEALKLIE